MSSTALAQTTVAPSSHSPITSDDHGPAIVIAAGISLGTALMALFMRLSQRWPRREFLELEDILLVLASLAEIANVAAIGLAVQHGLGKRADRLTTDQIDQAKRAILASFCVTFLTEALSALSFVSLIRSMNPKKAFHNAMFGVMAAVCAWALAGMIRFAVSTSSQVPDPGQTTWIGLAVVSCALQMTLMVSAFWTIWPLQMPIARKIGLSLWFSLFVPMIVVTAIRLTYTPKRTFAPDWTWDNTNMVIVSLVESNLTIINAAYPSVRGFLNQVSTGFLPAETTKDSKSGSHGGGSYALRSIGGRNTHKSAGQSRDTALSLGRVEKSIQTTAVKGDSTSDHGSFGSEVIMVRRSVEIDTTSVGGEGTEIR